MGRRGGGGGGHHSSRGSSHHSSSRGGSSHHFGGSSWSSGGSYSGSHWHGTHHRTIIVHDGAESTYRRNYPNPDTPEFRDMANRNRKIWFLVFIVLLCIPFLVRACYGREDKLDTSLVTTGEYDYFIEDDLGWLEEDIGSRGKAKVRDAMEVFRKKTGIAPALIITDRWLWESDDEIQDALDKVYDQKFQDEGHMIFCMVAGDGASDYSGLHIRSGSAANRIMTQAKMDRMYDLFDHYFYETDVDEYQIFASMFRRVDVLDNTTEFANDMLTFLIFFQAFALITCAIMQLTYVQSKRLVEKKEQEQRQTTVDAAYEKAAQEDWDNRNKI